MAAPGGAVLAIWRSGARKARATVETKPLAKPKPLNESALLWRHQTNIWTAVGENEKMG